MLVLVRSAEDAAAAVAGGADGLVADLRTGVTDGARGALDSIVDACGDRCPIAIFSASADQPLELCRDEVIGAVLATLPRGDLLWKGATLTAVLPGLGGDINRLIETAAAQGFGGVLFGDGVAPRLLQAVAIDTLDRLAALARRHALAVGFAGGMEMPDVPRLLALAPDFLVVDGLVREPRGSAGPIDPARMRFAREMIPVEGVAPLLGRPAPIGHDRIFVRDWTVSIEVGAYSHERAPQRARFSVEAAIARATGGPTDLRGVVTYDLITDAISRATAGHVDLVETLAEDVAALVLAHPRVVSVDITVEKLDLGPGSLGCRIVRGRPA